MMAKQLYMQALVQLPPDPFDAAEVYAKLRGPWLTLVQALAESGVKYDLKLEDMEGRTTAKMPRRPATKPKLVPANPPEAA